ncbi:hypothetical protein AK812_SmicGene12684 [Symbiodinium microadriaticum]|uniref:Uncharacterized protein n=1 Tax=Symbiodinium microadriaticum TaxID=2951 RepID=A0A1Q9EA52_SYMMI|nr:hypothetical protein AK812_SmicGene12684 [Symbiodinium microadriaticum]
MKTVLSEAQIIRLSVADLVKHCESWGVATSSGKSNLELKAALHVAMRQSTTPDKDRLQNTENVRQHTADAQDRLQNTDKAKNTADGEDADEVKNMHQHAVDAEDRPKFTENMQQHPVHGEALLLP